MDSLKKTGSGSEKTERFLCFSLADENFAMPLLAVKEVIGMPEVTPVPHSPAHFIGVMNLRGQIISIVDMRKVLGAKTETTGETCVIICDLNPIVVGAVVSSVNNVLNVAEHELDQKPDIQSSRAAEFVRSVINREDKLVLLVDIAKALGVESLVAAQNNLKKIA